MKKINLTLICAFYILAGINHFRTPAVYVSIMPPYLPAPEFLVRLSGVIEIALGIGMAFAQTRKLAAIGIILMLIAFIPAHIYIIQMNSCIDSHFCYPSWVGWVRLFPLQFIFIWWAWKSYAWKEDLRKGDLAGVY